MQMQNMIEAMRSNAADYRAQISEMLLVAVSDGRDNAAALIDDAERLARVADYYEAEVAAASIH